MVLARIVAAGAGAGVLQRLRRVGTEQLRQRGIGERGDVYRGAAGSNECSTTGRPLASWLRACSSSGNTGRADSASVRRNEPSCAAAVAEDFGAGGHPRLIALPGNRDRIREQRRTGGGKCR